MKYCDASVKSDLDWDIEPDPDGSYILDFGWGRINPRDEATFHRDYLAVEAFSKAFPDAKQVVMSHLDGDFVSLIELTESLEIEHGEGELPLQVFCAQLLSDYLHRLASALSEDAIPTVIVNPKKGSNRAILTLIFSRRRFEHFQVLFEGDPLPIQGHAKTVISLPQDHRFDAHFFTDLLKRYDLHTIKCIPEELLNEHWDEVIEIVYDPRTLGELGKRMLLGFEAAGGITARVDL